jgi:hypothetical protein
MYGPYLAGKTHLPGLAHDIGAVKPAADYGDGPGTQKAFEP